jgi:hypothetical protein
MAENTPPGYMLGRMSSGQVICTRSSVQDWFHICNASPLILLSCLSHQEKGASIQEEDITGQQHQTPKTDQLSYKGNCNLDLTVSHIYILFQAWGGGIHEVH